MRRKITNETWEQVKTAFASGIGLREIARSMGISDGTVVSRAKREGRTREIQSAKALVKRQDSALSVSPAQAVAMTLAQRGERHVERMAGVSEIAFAVGFLIAVVDRSSPSIARQKSILSKATLVGDNAH